MRARDNAVLSEEQAAVAARGVKAMIPVTGGRPFLDYPLSALAASGVTSVCLVIGPEHDEIRAAYSGRRPFGLDVAFATQQHPIGTANAVLAAEDFVDGETFLVMNSDNYYPPDVLRALRETRAPALPGFDRAGLLRDGLIPAERIAQYALLDVDDGFLREIVEKPDPDTFRRLADAPVSMNCWSFTPLIFEACRTVPISPRGELEIPLAVQHGIATLAMRLRVIPVDAAVLDLSHQADIAGVERALEAIRLDG